MSSSTQQARRGWPLAPGSRVANAQPGTAATYLLVSTLHHSAGPMAQGVGWERGIRAGYIYRVRD